jgi:hypothetical protein
MFSPGGEDQPAKPQERQEFNRQKPNSKARTGPAEDGAEADGVEEHRDPDCSSASEDPARARDSQSREQAGGQHDERPMPLL